MATDANLKAARFTRTKEDFTCLHCGARVAGNGYTDHCPWCLWSRHVDINPGDRAARCGGTMRPVRAVYAHGACTITYRCEGCGMEKRFKAAQDDSKDLLERLVGRN